MPLVHPSQHFDQSSCGPARQRSHGTQADSVAPKGSRAGAICSLGSDALYWPLGFTTQGLWDLDWGRAQTLVIVIWGKGQMEIALSSQNFVLPGAHPCWKKCQRPKSCQKPPKEHQSHRRFVTEWEPRLGCPLRYSGTLDPVDPPLSVRLPFHV